MKEILVEKREDALRIAVKENNELVEFLVDENNSNAHIGEIYKGRIKNILPSMNSIFIDIGLEKEAYMYYSEELKKQNIKKGQDILVEVIKEQLGNKGAKVTNKVSLASKYIVITIGSFGVSISKRIGDSNEKERLNNLIKPIDGIGIVLRTEAILATDEQILKELNYLLEKKSYLQDKVTYSKNIGKIDSNNLYKKFFEEIDDVKSKVLIDDDELFYEIQKIVELKNEISLELYDKKRSLFEEFFIEKELLKLRHKKVNLKCGGYIVIEPTEAMYVIDVNTGKNTKCRDFNKTILTTNLNAAKEVAKQIKLRNLSGIIVIDFIDMREKNQKPDVLRELKKGLLSDKGNTKIFPFTELDLIQISRKRKGKSIYEYLEDKCSKCNGSGFLLKLSYIQKLIKNEIEKSCDENSINDFYIELSSNYKEEIEEDLFSFMKNINGLNKEIYLNFSDNIDGYLIEPLIFNNQKENYDIYKVKSI